MHGMNISIDLKNIGRRLLNERPEVILSGKKRVPNLDALKLMSLLLVVCVHCAGEFYYMKEINALWSVTRLVYCCGVVAIPIFFMVSGYQLLGRKISGYIYALKKIAKILKASAVMYLIVLFLEWLLLDEEIVIVGIPRQFCLSLLQKGDYGFLWFVGGMCLVYLVYPVINWIYREKKKQFLMLTGALVGLMSLFFFVSVVRPTPRFISEFDVPQTLRLWNWLGYFCMGGLVKRYDIFDNVARWSIVAAMTLGCFIFLNLIDQRRGIWFFEYTYTSLPVIFFSIAVFVCFMKLKIHHNTKFLEGMAVLFMPAYLLGPILMFWIQRPMSVLPEFIGAILFAAVNVAMSLTGAWLLMKIPGMNRLLKL